MRKGFETADTNHERRSGIAEEGRRIVGDRSALRRAGTKCARCRNAPATQIDPTSKRTCCDQCARIERHDREFATLRTRHAASR